MKCFIESTWAPWVQMPATIADWYALNPDRTQRGHTDLYKLPEWQTAIQNGDFVIDGTNPNDYLTHNTDGTTSLGFWQPNLDVARKWAEVCRTRMRPGQIEHICVAIPEEQDDPVIGQLSYAARLNAGLISPYVF